MSPQPSLFLLVIQPIGETLRPVWGPMDKCYPVTAQVGKGWGLLLPWSGVAALGLLGGHTEKEDGPGREGPLGTLSCM